VRIAFLPARRGLFVVLSAADLLLTWWLLERSGGTAYEANPLARWWLLRSGWAGLAAFKAAQVVLVLGLAALIARRRPRSAGRLLTFACAALAAVVLYSASLCRGAAHGQTALRQALEHDARLDSELARAQAYRAALKRARAALLAGRCTLAEAVDELAGTERGRDPAWLALLARRNPGRTAREMFALELLQPIRRTVGR
jgi:hypothetical protein